MDNKFMKPLKSLLLLVLLSTSLNSMADGILRTIDLKKYCNQDGVDRQTVIYLDQSIIAKKDPNWYRDIINKTKFLPGERVQVVTIKDGGSSVEQAWDTCYPAYTTETLRSKKEEENFTTLFTGGIEDALKNDRKAFKSRIQQALAHPLAGSRHEQAPKFKAGSFPRKKLVEAFYYDANRTDLESGIARIIVFSDMIENSDLINDDFSPIEAADKTVKRFPTSFNHASLFIYGINYTNNDTALNERMERFWRRYFLKSGAEIAHYGTQLVLPKNDDRFVASSYKGKLVQSDGKELATSLRLAYQPDGELVYSWFTIGDNNMTLKGTINCSGQNCKIDAEVKESAFEGFKPRDALLLEGSLNGLTGTVGARDDTVIDSTGKIYRFKVSYEKQPKLVL